MLNHNLIVKHSLLFLSLAIFAAFVLFTAAGRTDSGTRHRKITDVTKIGAYLSTSRGGSHSSDPIVLVIELQLTDPMWQDILAAIDTAQKFVSLDLATCTRSGTDTGGGLRSNGNFDPLRDINTGKDKIVNLTLPLLATGIIAITYSDPIFRNFTALKTVTGRGVSSIGASLFSGCTALTSISFPQATTIGSSAFSGCSALTSVNLPQADTIGTGAFRGCSSLTSISLPAATAINNRTFARLTNLTSVDAPLATSIGSGAFDSCIALTSVNIPQAATIGSSAFYGCSSLTSVNLPQADTIGSSAFDGCTSLTSVSIPKAKSIGGGAFDGCTALNSVTMSSGLSQANFHNAAFANGSNKIVWTLDGKEGEWSTVENGTLLIYRGSTLVYSHSANGDITLPVTITNIGRFAFAGCTRLTSVSAPGVTTIGNDAFSGCTALASINFPKVNAIGHSAFYGCSALTRVSFPLAVSIGYSAFYGCSALTRISFPANAVIGERAFAGCVNLSFTIIGTGSLNVLEGGKILTRNNSQVAAYPSATGDLTLPLNITNIDNSAFANCATLTSITIPWAINIGTSAFSGCIALTRVNLPQTVFIGEWAFSGCSALSSISIPQAATIGTYAFFYCLALTSVTISKRLSLESFDNAAFAGGANKIVWTLAGNGGEWTTEENGAALIYQGNTLMYNHSARGDIVLPDTITTIGNSAFSGCSALTSIRAPEVVTIGNDVFTGCTSLTSADIPAAATIGDYAFETCAALARITFGVTPPTLGTTIFSGINAARMITIEIPESAKGAYGVPRLPDINFDSNSAADSWGRAFRGKGWDGTYLSGIVNTNIILVFKTY